MFQMRLFHAKNRHKIYHNQHGYDLIFLYDNKLSFFIIFMNLGPCRTGQDEKSFCQGVRGKKNRSLQKNQTFLGSLSICSRVLSNEVSGVQNTIHK